MHVKSSVELGGSKLTHSQEESTYSVGDLLEKWKLLSESPLEEQVYSTEFLQTFPDMRRDFIVPKVCVCILYVF